MTILKWLNAIFPRTRAFTRLLQTMPASFQSFSFFIHIYILFWRKMCTFFFSSMIFPVFFADAINCRYVSRTQSKPRWPTAVENLRPSVSCHWLLWLWRQLTKVHESVQMPDFDDGPGLKLLYLIITGDKPERKFALG